MGVKDDINLLEEYYTKYIRHHFKKAFNTPHDNAEGVIPFTNELLTAYPKEDLKNKKVLTVTSSGDHVLDAIYNGAKEITAFDFNRFAKYYSALKIAMIKKYSHDEFIFKIESFTKLVNDVTTKSNKNITNNINAIRKIIDEVSLYLSNEELMFWNSLIEILMGQTIDRLFFYGNYASIYNNHYSNKAGFELIKSNLCDSTIKYVDSNISDIKDNVSDCFDVGYLSNILVKMSDKTTMENILNDVINAFNNDSVIYSYCFGKRKISDIPVIEGYSIKTKEIVREYWDADQIWVYESIKK